MRRPARSSAVYVLLCTAAVSAGCGVRPHKPLIGSTAPRAVAAADREDEVARRADAAPAHVARPAASRGREAGAASLAGTATPAAAPTTGRWSVTTITHSPQPRPTAAPPELRSGSTTARNPGRSSGGGWILYPLLILLAGAIALWLLARRPLRS